MCTEIIVLKKIKYKETSLIINSISRDCGRLDFLIKGGLKITNKQTPIFDLFRVIEVEFKESNSDLIIPLNSNLILNYDELSKYPKLFVEACKSSDFILKNCFYHIKSNLLYKAFNTLLTNYVKGKNYDSSLIKLLYLFENGLLDINSETTNPRQQSALKKLLSIALSDSEEFDFNTNYFKKIKMWIDEECIFHNLNISSV